MINLQMNSLEDAFINIGMDEDKYFAPNNGAGKLSHGSGDLQSNS